MTWGFYRDGTRSPLDCFKLKGFLYVILRTHLNLIAPLELVHITSKRVTEALIRQLLRGLKRSIKYNQYGFLVATTM